MIGWERVEKPDRPLIFIVWFRIGYKYSLNSSSRQRVLGNSVYRGTGLKYIVLEGCEFDPHLLRKSAGFLFRFSVSEIRCCDNFVKMRNNNIPSNWPTLKATGSYGGMRNSHIDNTYTL